jgi:hypothetical protein
MKTNIQRLARYPEKAERAEVYTQNSTLDHQSYSAGGLPIVIVILVIYYLTVRTNLQLGNRNTVGPIAARVPNAGRDEYGA